MELICPYCQFSKEVPKEKIPTGAKSAVCPRCAQRFAISIPVQGPGSVTEKAKADKALQRTGTPWERRSEVGLWQGIYQTSRAVFFSPERLFSNLTFTEGKGEPLAFGLLLGSIGCMFGMLWQFLILAGGLFSFDLLTLDQLTIGLLFLALLVIIPVFVTAGIFLYSGVLHLLLLIVRGGKNGYEATFRVVSYSQATQVLGLIPVVGGWIGGIWQLIVQIIGLREIHETSYLRVIVAFLIPVALLFLLLAAVIIPLLIYLFGNASAY